VRRDSRQQPLYPVTQFLPEPLEKGSFYDVLHRFGRFIVRSSDFPQSDPLKGGLDGWCQTQLSFLVLIQRKHDWTDRETVRRATADLHVKACLDMGVEQLGPSQPTLCRHRQLMQELGLDQRYNDRFRDLLEALELVGDDEAVLVDSVPIHGAGQQLDSYNLLARAIRKGLKELAVKQGRGVDDVAEVLGLTVYLNRSIKGRFDVDWQDEASRRAFLERLVNDALLIRRCLCNAGDLPTSDANDDASSTEKSPLTPLSKRGGPTDESLSSSDDDDASSTEAEDNELTATEIIDKVIEHDVEFDSENKVKGIRQHAADDRIISVTDPQMRHGRKSASKLFSGFKAQIISSLLFGFIVMVRVIKANIHDGRDLPAMADELRKQGLEPSWWGGDHAYGTLSNHRFFDDPERGELVARMPRPSNGDRFTKDEFDYDFENATLCCPEGHTLSQGRWATRNGHKGKLFEFGKCQNCPSKAKCINPKAKSAKGRSVFIVDEQERLIRQHLDRRQQPEFLERLSNRSDVERVIAGFAQCGGKKAHRFGMADNAFDANLSALAYNLRRLGSLMKSDESLERQVAQLVGRFGLFIRWLLMRILPFQSAGAVS
jgi:hypothetical protein